LALHMHFFILLLHYTAAQLNASSLSQVDELKARVPTAGGRGGTFISLEVANAF